MTDAEIHSRMEARLRGVGLSADELGVAMKLVPIVNAAAQTIFKDIDGTLSYAAAISELSQLTVEFSKLTPAQEEIPGLAVAMGIIAARAEDISKKELERIKAAKVAMGKL